MKHQTLLFGESPKPAERLSADRIALTTEIQEMLREGAPVAIGISGGKDSCALAFALTEFLEGIGHTGPRVLIHSDLGSVEWADSLPTCERLAQRLGLELVVVRRAAGGLMERWKTRWENNVGRYVNLECVKLILPWSTPSMRFCTSELKTAVICRDLVERFPGQTILSASGIRRQESAKRALAPIVKAQAKLTSATFGTTGFDWNALLHWTQAEVYAYLQHLGFRLPDAYRIFHSTRFSCVFCMMGSEHDLRAGASCADNAPLYREQVSLEIESTFAFQEGKWLGDVAPSLLTEGQRHGLGKAKQAARLREAAEALIPPHLLYVKGWPICIPTVAEARLLCSVRSRVADAVGLDIRYTHPQELIGRYEEMLTAKGRVKGGTGMNVQCGLDMEILEEAA